MILGLHRQGLSLSAVAWQTGLGRKTVRRYIERGLESPTYTPRQPCIGKICGVQGLPLGRDPACHRNHRPFALEGGTTTNRFVRDLPRLSVAIDLTYVPMPP